MTARPTPAEVVGIWCGQAKTLLRIDGVERVAAPPIEVARYLEPGMALTVYVDARNEIARYLLPPGIEQRSDLVS